MLTLVHTKPGPRHLKTLNPRVMFRRSYPTLAPPRRDSVGPIAKDFSEDFRFWAELTRHFPPNNFASWVVSRLPSLQLAISPDQMAHIRSQFAMCHPLWSHVLDLSQLEQLIHSDILGSPHHVIHLYTSAMKQISHFWGDPIDSKQRHRSMVRETEVGPQAELCIRSLGASTAFGRMDYSRPI